MYHPIVESISIEEYIQRLMNAASTRLPNPNDDRFIRKEETLQMTALTLSAMKQRIKDGTFPKPIKIGNRYRMWSLNAVQLWMEQQKTAV